MSSEVPYSRYEVSELSQLAACKRDLQGCGPNGTLVRRHLQARNAVWHGP